MNDISVPESLQGSALRDKDQGFVLKWIASQCDRTRKTYSTITSTQFREFTSAFPHTTMEGIDRVKSGFESLDRYLGIAMNGATSSIRRNLPNIKAATQIETVIALCDDFQTFFDEHSEALRMSESVVSSRIDQADVVLKERRARKIDHLSSAQAEIELADRGIKQREAISAYIGGEFRDNLMQLLPALNAQINQLII